MAVNKVELANGEVLIDLTDDSVDSSTLIEGATAHDASGARITGSYVPPAIPTKVSAFENDAKYVTESTLDGYSKIDHTHLIEELGETISVDFSTIKNSYVSNSNGSFIAYNGWDQTNYISINPEEQYYATWTASSMYNAFYDSTKKFISSFNVNSGRNLLNIPSGAKFMALSNTSSAMAGLKIHTIHSIKETLNEIKDSVPTKVSQLENDSKFTTESDVNAALDNLPIIPPLIGQVHTEDAENYVTPQQVYEQISKGGTVSLDTIAKFGGIDIPAKATAFQIQSYDPSTGEPIIISNAIANFAGEPINIELLGSVFSGVWNVILLELITREEVFSNDFFTLTEAKTYTDERVNTDVPVLVDNRIEEILAKGPNVTFVGMPTYSNGVLSGFSAANYAEFPFMVDLRSKSFTISFVITTGSNITNQQNIIDSEFGLAVAIKDSKFLMAMSSNGWSWDYGQFVGTHTLNVNTTYFVKLEYTLNGPLTLSYGTDGTNYTTDITKTGVTNLYPKPMIIGTGDIFGAPKPFGGSINLNYASLYVNDILVWKGVADVSAQTRLAVNLSNIDDEGKEKIVQIVDDGGFAKESDLTGFATKSDLSGYAKKADTYSTQEINLLLEDVERYAQQYTENHVENYAQPRNTYILYGTIGLDVQEIFDKANRGYFYACVDMENMQFANMTRADLSTYQLVFANDKYRYFLSLIDNSWSMEEIQYGGGGNPDDIAEFISSEIDKKLGTVPKAEDMSF